MSATDTRRLTEQEAIEDILRRTEYRDGELRWLGAPWNQGSKAANIIPGKIAGHVNHGYRRIGMVGYGSVLAHRAIYFLFHKNLPLIVDHIDGNPSNNAIENLRAATLSQNQMNSKQSVKNTSGRKGVFWHKRAGKWTASIRVNDKLKHLGVFENFESAVMAREKAEKEHHGEFARAV